MSVPATAHDYTILGLRPSASLAEVEEAFQRLAIEHHPQRSGDPRAVERFEALRDAYQRIKGSGAGRVYRVGESQPEDASAPAPSTQWVPFAQARWEPEVKPRSLWQTIRPYALRVQGGIAVIALILAANFALTRWGGDASQVRALAAAPSCASAKATDATCLLDQEATVMATTTSNDTPWVGTFTEGLRLGVGPLSSVVEMGVSRPDSGVAYGGLLVGDAVTAQSWHGHVVDVTTSRGDVMITDDNPNAIAARHQNSALAWLVTAVVLGFAPALALGRWLRRRRAAEDE